MPLSYTPSDEFIVNQVTEGSQGNPHTIPLTDGRYLIIWGGESEYSDGYGNVFGQIYNADGTIAVSEFDIDANDEPGAYIIPHASALPNGEFVVAWSGIYRPEPDVRDTNITLQIYNADGTPKGDVITVNTNDDTFYNTHINVNIADLSNGTFVVTWDVSFGDASSQNIHIVGRIFNNDGTPTGDVFPVSTNNAEDSVYSETLPYPDGSFIVTWVNTPDQFANTSDPFDYNVYARTYNADGTPLGEPVIIAQSENQITADLTLLSSGDFVAVLSENFNSPYKQSAQIYDQNGTPRGAAIEFEGITLLDIEGLPNGGFVLLYRDHQSRDISAKIFDALGNETHDLFVTDNDEHNLSIDLATFDDNSFIVTWGDGDVSAKKFSSDIPNTDPVAVKDSSYTALSGEEHIFNPLVNDYDAEGQNLSITKVWKVDAGNSVILNDDGTITFTASPDYVGTDYMYYEISDGNGGKSTSSIQVNVSAPPNTDPVAVKDRGYTAQSGEEHIFDPLANDYDAEGQHLSITRVWKVDAGNSVTLNDDGTITFTAGENYTGNDYMYYEISDSHGGTTTSSIQVTVTAPVLNTNPVAVKNSGYTALSGEEHIFDPLANDYDAEGQHLSITRVWKVDAGNSVTLNDDGTITFTAGENYTGTDYMYYEISDSHGGKSTSSIQVSVSATDADIEGTHSSETIHGTDNAESIAALNGDDTVFAGAGDDVIYSGKGSDILYGEGGADIFVFDNDDAFSGIDTIQDFNMSDNDALDLSDILVGYDPLNDAIGDFVQITDNGVDSTVSVDSDGGADNFVAIATLLNVTGADDEALIETSGNLITT